MCLHACKGVYSKESLLPLSKQESHSLHLYSSWKPFSHLYYRCSDLNFYSAYCKCPLLGLLTSDFSCPHPYFLIIGTSFFLEHSVLTPSSSHLLAALSYIPKCLPCSFLECSFSLIPHFHLWKSYHFPKVQLEVNTLSLSSHKFLFFIFYSAHDSLLCFMFHLPC